jgi:hypothetical protein
MQAGLARSQALFIGYGPSRRQRTAPHWLSSGAISAVGMYWENSGRRVKCVRAKRSRRVLLNDNECDFIRECVRVRNMANKDNAMTQTGGRYERERSPRY